ncbi:hypothetical protein O181_006658 [Austropuccinia psidii MF-1]|uniref:Uncharacterized protein n=1 Tax=Austropuccinia psidii MF-1 TaxID=1389203 RepID=A0A9Q3GGT1_9BASI|nr:hypothetical protein [Austropuccinia psidii MF-1]
MEDYRTSTSPQMLANNFKALIESTEADIASITAFRAEKLPTRSSRDIPVSVQELVYGRNTEGVGTFSNPLDRKNELISPSKEVLRTRKNRGPFERLEPNFCQRASPTDKSLVDIVMNVWISYMCKMLKFRKPNLPEVNFIHLDHLVSLIL